MEEKEESEWRIINRFKKEYHKFPQGLIMKCERPDFKIKTIDKLIGIEVTKIFQDTIKGKSKLQQSSSEQSLFTSKMINKLQPQIPFNFGIGIGLNQNIQRKKSDTDKIIDQIYRVCMIKLLGLSNKEYINIDDVHVLPPEIQYIHLQRYDLIESSFDLQFESGPVANLTDAHIEQIISKKDEKIKKYTLCDEYWLLIWEGEYFAGTFGDLKIKQKFISVFDKVFLIRNYENQILVLK